MGARRKTLGNSRICVARPKPNFFQNVRKCFSLVRSCRYHSARSHFGIFDRLFVSDALGLLNILCALARTGTLPLAHSLAKYPHFCDHARARIWIGFGIWPKILVAALVVFSPMVVTTLHGFKSADLDFMNMLKLMGASRWQMFRKNLGHKIPVPPNSLI